MDEGTAADTIAEGVEEPSPRPRRRISQRRLKLAAIVIIVVIVVAVLLWGMVPEQIYEVDEVLKSPGRFDGEEISIKGVIIEWESGRSNFTFADDGDRTKYIMVDHEGPIPEGFGVNVTAVVKGTFHKGATVHNVVSKEIQIGCPSKY